MKKLTALLVVTAMLCMSVSCGNYIIDEIESSVASVSEEITEPETEEISKTSVEGTEEYAEVIESLFECAKNRDRDGIVHLCFPDKYCDTMRILDKMGLYSLYNGLYSWICSIDYGLVSIDSVEPVSEEYIPYFNLYYGCFQPEYEYIEKNGTENLDKDELSELLSTPVPESLDRYFNIEKAVIVDTTISREFNDGTVYPEFENIIDYEFELYYIDGEGWKLDVLTMGTLYEAEKTMVSDELENLYSASETVLTGLEETGTEIPENFIICSDSSRNYNVSEEFLNTFDNALEECYQKKDGFDYFVVINDGELACVVGQYSEKLRRYRTFPIGYLYNEDQHVLESYDERYNLCLDRMKNGQPQSYMKYY